MRASTTANTAEVSGALAFNLGHLAPRTHVIQALSNADPTRTVVHVHTVIHLLYMHMTAAACSKRTYVYLSDEEVAKTTNAAARCSVHLRGYFVEQGISDAYHAAIQMCADEVFRRANVKMRPTTPHSFTICL